jgi:ankyrin repeat protein
LGVATQRNGIGGYCIISSLIPSSSKHKQLFDAIHNHDLNTVRELFTIPGAENARDSHYKTPLHVALLEKDEDIILFLIRNSRDVNHRDGLFFTRYTPLHYAIFCGEKIIQELLKHGADIDAVGYQKETPLNLACRFNLTDAALLLINSGADLYIGDCSCGPMYQSIENDNLAIVQSMIDNGFNVDRVRRNGYGIVHHAAKYNNTRIIELLAANGANLNAVYKKSSRRSYKEMTPYDIAVKYKSAEAAELLAKLGARPYKNKK